uniref:Uncharacterized protein n=1 Tax=Lepeophtheirus salmonis TaxID=72036 RepID=A0A0K2T2V3_LEPSM
MQELLGCRFSVLLRDQRGLTTITQQQILGAFSVINEPTQMFNSSSNIYQ